MTRRGEQEGEQGLARGVPPLRERTALIWFTVACCSILSSPAANECMLSVCRSHYTVGVLCRQPDFATVLVTSLTVPWRERPRLLTAFAITPAATDGVAHATLSLPVQPSSISA